MQLDRALLKVASLAWQEEQDSAIPLEAAENWGRYDGLPPHIALLDDGRIARLLKRLDYIDPRGQRWDVPEGEEVDGASIPQPLWSLIGGPWDGPYRNASIVHDRYCVTKSATWQHTHRMFYEAMRCSDVKKFKAKIMFYAVYRFGPRWPEPGSPEAALEGVAAMTPVPMEPHADELVADAESIFALDPSIDEIVALAETREAQSGDAAMLEAPGDTSDKARRASLLVIPGGSGTVEDCTAVATEAVALPEFVFRHFERKKVRIVACRGSVTDFERDLRGEVPRGWEGLGKTWDDVPGTYFEGHKRVVVATIARGGTRAVPGKDSGLHGSANLTAHESLHGFDYSTGHSALRDESFNTARAADFASLDSYQKQAGNAGIEETFAESGAHYGSNPTSLKATAPHLFAYWDGRTASAEETIGSSSAPLEAVEAIPVGTAVLGEGGAIELDLRAEGPGGAIGHAMLRVYPGEAAYSDLVSQLYPEGISESRGDVEPVLFYGLGR